MVIIRYNIGCGSVRFRPWLVVLSLASPSFTLDDPVRTTQHLLDRVYSLIPPAFRPSHIAPLAAPPPIVQGCFRNHINSTLLTIEQEGFPIYYGHTPVTSHAVAAQSVLAIFPPNSPLTRTLHKFQSLVSRPPNCYIQFKLCACGSVHGYLTSLIDLDAATPLFVGDPPVDHLDFVIQFEGGAFREHRVGGSGIVLWKHTTQGLTLLDTFAVPLFPCPDAAYAETVGAAHAVLMAARHFPHHRPSRILIKGDNRPIIDFMNSVGKLRRTDLQKLLTEAQHALAFSLPPILWSYTPREFNKCADFLAGIARDYAKQSLTPELLPYSLSPFSFPLPPSLSSSILLLLPLLFLLHPRPLPFTNLLTFRSPPSLSLLAKLFTPLRYSATFEPSKKAPLHLPRYLSFVAPRQMISEDAFTPLRLGPPNFLGITAPFCLVAPILKLILLALIISFSNASPSLSLDISLPLSTNFGHFFLLILLLRTRTSLNNTPLLQGFAHDPAQFLPRIHPVILPGQRILALSSDTGPSPSNLSDQTPPPRSFQSILRTPYIVIPYLCEPFLSYHGTSRNPLAQIFHLLHIVSSLDL